MEEKLVKILKAGRSIEPTQEFRLRSENSILASRQNRTNFFATIKSELLENFKFSLALSLASILILVIFGSFSYWKSNSAQETANLNLNGQELLTEIQALDFQIQLGEAQYFNESALEIAALLKEIKTPVKGAVDELLNQIIN